MTSICVNQTEISEAEILAEAQNHPASDPEQALAEAREALVIRELLLQAAQTRGLQPDPRSDEEGRRETDDEALIRALLETEIKVPDADDASCRRYYDNNIAQFQSPDIYEAAHILLAAHPSDSESYDKAVAEAEAIIELLGRDPNLFESIARERSACPSNKDGGRLGQVTKGQTVPEFETFLFELEEGQLCPVPVRTGFGAHVLRLDRKIPGRQVPFEIVAEQIAAYLEEASWRRAVAQYIQILAGQATISGIDLQGSRSPLVQ